MSRFAATPRILRRSTESLRAKTITNSPECGGKTLRLALDPGFRPHIQARQADRLHDFTTRLPSPVLRLLWEKTLTIDRAKHYTKHRCPPWVRLETPQTAEPDASWMMSLKAKRLS